MICAILPYDVSLLFFYTVYSSTLLMCQLYIFLRNSWIDQRISTNGIVFGTYALIWVFTGSIQSITFPIAYCYITSFLAPTSFTNAKVIGNSILNSIFRAFNAFTMDTYRTRWKFYEKICLVGKKITKFVIRRSRQHCANFLIYNVSKIFPGTVGKIFVTLQIRKWAQCCLRLMTTLVFFFPTRQIFFFINYFFTHSQTG